MNENTDNDEDQLLLKQELLKSEIVAKNYDGSKFLQYCLDQKENGDDMNNWTYDELKKCVEDFIETQKPKPENKPPEQPKEKEVKNSNKSVLEKKKEKENKIESNKDANEKNDQIKDQYVIIDNKKKDKEESLIESKIKELPCKILEKSILSNKDIKVTIKNPKTNGKGFSTYVTYEVLTEPSCWSVRRRYSDFTTLRQILSKYYPRMLIPPLPEKKVGNKRFKQDFIERRMKFLELFINDVCKNESFKANEALIYFLNFNDHTQFEKRMKELNNYNAPHNFDEIKTLTGKITTLLDDYSTDKFINSINNFCKSEKQVFNKLSNSLKIYCRHITEACKSLEEVSKSFEELHNLNIDIEIKEPITKTYNILSYFFKVKGEIMSKENEIIHEKIKGFFKLQRLKNNSFIDIAENRDILKQKYTTENNKLYSKKEKLYAIKDINKWEITNIEELDKPLLLRDKNYAFEHMCVKDTQSLNNIYKHLTYANYMNYIEFQKIIDINIKSYVETTKEFSKLIYSFYDDGMKLWKKLNTYI